jgi:CSLREA domain-containing protein
MQVELLEDRQLLATITVNTTVDDPAASSTLSLREAIEVSDGTLPISSLSTQQQAQVNGALFSANTIDFNIPTTDPGYDAATGVWTIAPKSALPAISTNAALINGYSQPGASQNTLNFGDNAKLAIAINGAGLGMMNGLTINSQFTQVSGLDIENFGGPVTTGPRTITSEPTQPGRRRSATVRPELGTSARVTSTVRKVTSRPET